MAIIFNPGLTYHFTETWNNGATAFDGLSFDAQDMASAAGSNLLRLGVGGVDKFSVRKDSRVRYGPDAANHWSHLVAANGDLAMTGVGSTGGAFSVTPMAGKNINFALSGAGDFAVNTNQLYVDTSAGNVGIGTTGPGAKLHVDSVTPSAAMFQISRSDATKGIRFANYEGTGQTFALQRSTNLSAWSDLMSFNPNNGNVGIGTTGPTAKAHVSQASTTAAIPVLHLNQADLSEELIRFESTVGVGNPIEAIGGKTLTPTHLVRVHIQGVGNLYMQAGTAA